MQFVIFIFINFPHIFLNFFFFSFLSLNITYIFQHESDNREFFPYFFGFCRGVLQQGRMQYEEAIQSYQLAIQYRPSLACKYYNSVAER